MNEFRSMILNPLTAISPVDGRYRRQTEELAAYFSELGLMKYRVLVEVEYLIALAEMPLPQLDGKLSAEHKKQLREVVSFFGEADATWIKETEKTTNHDVKAVEYFVKEKLKGLSLEGISEFVHFGLTSQDINNTAIPLSLKEGLAQCMIPMKDILKKLQAMQEQWSAIPMLARTHGQPASPTRLGKEFGVFAERLQKQMNMLSVIPFAAKFGGATGNFNAHHVAYPEVDWVAFANGFVNDKLGLSRSQLTTQIEHYDMLAALADCMKRINTILMDMCQDIWLYVSQDYFKQKLKEGEVGSSAMPHKVNPIDFENAEGNLGLANAIYEYLSRKLPISRLQRDLTDSTVLRNVGMPLAHGLIAMKSILKGLDKLILNENKLNADLEANWAVVAEAIQTILRREGYPKPYEALKALTRSNEAITRETMLIFIQTLDVSDALKAELIGITPHGYTGL